MAKHSAVPEVAGVNLDFIPFSYFALRELHLALPSDIKGQARRTMARAVAQSGDGLADDLQAPELSADDRRAWGLIHPAMMGGEYLPSLRKDEVEIARISLRSVTADQISVRARRVGRRIDYTIVDEYGDELREEPYRVHPASSATPLSMRQLVALLDGACEHGGAVMQPVVWHIEDGVCGIDEMRGFVSVESDFYADLGRYYEARFAHYFAQLEESSRDDDSDEGCDG